MMTHVGSNNHQRFKWLAVLTGFLEAIICLATNVKKSHSVAQMKIKNLLNQFLSTKP